RWDVIDAGVLPTARFADALKLLNDSLTVRPVLEVDPENVLRGLFDDLEIPDISFPLQHFCDAHLDLRRRDVHVRSLDPQGIADARQHVGDGISHHGSNLLTLMFTNWPFWRRESDRRGTDPGNRCGKSETSDTPPADARKAGTGAPSAN